MEILTVQGREDTLNGFREQRLDVKKSVIKLKVFQRIKACGAIPDLNYASYKSLQVKKTNALVGERGCYRHAGP